MPQEVRNLLRDHFLDIAAAGECLGDLVGVNVELHRRLAPGDQVALVVRGNVDDESVFALVEALVFPIDRKDRRATKQRRIERVDDPL